MANTLSPEAKNTLTQLSVKAGELVNNKIVPLAQVTLTRGPSEVALATAAVLVMGFVISDIFKEPTLR